MDRTRQSKILALVFLAGCGSVQVNDHVFCADKAGNGAHCAHTLTTETFDVPYEQWVLRRFGQACTYDAPDNLGDTLADLKRTLEQACSKCDCCDYTLPDGSKKKLTSERINQFFGALAP